MKLSLDTKCDRCQRLVKEIGETGWRIFLIRGRVEALDKFLKDGESVVCGDCLMHDNTEALAWLLQGESGTDEIFRMSLMRGGLFHGLA